MGARLVLPKASPWQRLAVVATIALAYELGQAKLAGDTGLHGRGYGVSPKDWAMGVAGAALLEVLLPKRRRVHTSAHRRREGRPARR